MKVYPKRLDIYRSDKSKVIVKFKNKAQADNFFNHRRKKQALNTKYIAPKKKVTKHKNSINPFGLKNVGGFRF